MPVIYDKEMGRQWLEESFGDQPMNLAAVSFSGELTSVETS
jgi:hypothetical protein